jgi:calcium-dependent protein kinase
VIKAIDKRVLRNQERFKLEIECLKKLDNPGILKLYEYFEDESYVYLITEYCKGGELFDRIVEEDHFEEQEAARLFRQILQNLNYIHSKEVVHRDLKPENFMFDSDDKTANLKIIDFGLSKHLIEDTGSKKKNKK